MSHHFDSPTAIEDGRINLCDVYAFDDGADRSSLVLTVNPDAGRSSPTTLRPDALYEFVVAGDAGTIEDPAWRMTVSEPTADGHQRMTIRYVEGPASRTGVDGTLLGEGDTGVLIPLAGGGRAWLGVVADRFWADGVALGGFLQVLAAGAYRPELLTAAPSNLFEGRNVTAVALQVPTSVRRRPRHAVGADQPLRSSAPAPGGPHGQPHAPSTLLPRPRPGHRRATAPHPASRRVPIPWSTRSPTWRLPATATCRRSPSCSASGSMLPTKGCVDMAGPLMPTIERAMARNLRDYVAAYRLFAPNAGATSSEVAGGVASFTGLDSPLTTLKGAGPHLSTRDLGTIEAFFRDHGAATVTIEMAPWLTDETARTLTESGYRAVGHEDVVVSGSRRAEPGLPVEDVAIETWPAVMRRCYELVEGSDEEDLVAASAALPGCRLYGVRDATAWIGCAAAVPYDSVVIFGNDGTRPEARGRGAQRALIDARLGALPAGRVAVAEVAPGSGSERNYLRSGFHIAYTRTHFVRSLN